MRFILTTLIILVSLNSFSKEQEFIQGSDDIPIYEGFVIQDESDSLYDSVQGKILSAIYTSKDARVVDVVDFYEISLAELGWEKKDKNTYTRENESLTLDVYNKDAKIFIKFDYLSSR